MLGCDPPRVHVLAAWSFGWYCWKVLETFRDGFPVKLTGKSKSLALEGTVLFLIVFTRMGHCEKASLAPSHYVTPSPTSTVIPSAVRPSQEIEQRGRSAADV